MDKNAGFSSQSPQILIHYRKLDNPGAIYSPMTRDTQVLSIDQALKKDRFCITMRFALIIEFFKIPTKMSATSLSIEVDVTELVRNK